MKKVTQYYTIILLATILIFCSCTDKNYPNAQCEDAVCTKDFRTILITIKDENLNPIAIDSFKVIDLSNGADITITLSTSGFQMAQQNGEYPLVNDMSFSENSQKQIQFYA